MNFNNFTIKAKKRQAGKLAQSYRHQQIENEHLLKALFEVDENVTPFILKNSDNQRHLLHGCWTNGGIIFQSSWWQESSLSGKPLKQWNKPASFT